MTSYVHVLLQAIAQMNEMEKNISCLGKFINDKEQPMKLARKQLDIRTNRPNVELCCNPVQYRLIQEVHEIENSVGNLEARHSNLSHPLKDFFVISLTLRKILV